MAHRTGTWLLVGVTIFLAGCPKKATGPVSTRIPGFGKKDYSRPLPPGQWALRKIEDPAQIPDFTRALEDTTLLRQAVARSLNYLGKPSSRNYFPQGHEDFTHDRAVATLQVFDTLLASGRDPATLNRLIRANFHVYMSVGCDDEGTVLYTSYYTPIFNASRQKTAEFRYPLYRKPADLEKDAEGKVLGRRMASGELVPYPPREQIESSNMLAGTELVYLADKFEVYIAHVQGSARLRMRDGQLTTVGYTATNGHDYNSISMQMIEDGKIEKDKLSLQSMIAYFQAHPDEVDFYVNQNPRYVFFGESDDLPRGTINEPVTPLYSIATDKQIYPRACLAFLDTEIPFRRGAEVVNVPYTGFALDQDAGGAIRAPGLCDLYRGVGDEAGELAGRTYREGYLYYLCLKSDSPLAGGAAAASPSP